MTPIEAGAFAFAPLAAALIVARFDRRRVSWRGERSARAGSSWSVPSRRGRHI